MDSTLNSLDTLIVSPEESGVRLDKFLSLHFPKYSRTYFQYLIEEGCVLVNGQLLKKREAPKSGDEIEICFRLTPELSLEPEDIPLDILFEDKHLIVINKKAGMVVHPAIGHPSHTFVNALLHHCHISSNDTLRPGIVHRLDKDTSGVLIAAKTSDAHQRLVSIFSNRKIEKSYLAVCLGNPKDALINAPIARHPIRRKEMAVVEGGKEAISRCNMVAFDGKLSVVRVELITGRTHQIRVHLKHLGTPVLGDAVYGNMTANQKYGAERQLLHAYQVKFTHPITGEQIHLTAPIPEDMKKFVDFIQEKNKH